MAQEVDLAGGGIGKIRNFWVGLGLTILTLGIYYFCWYYFVNDELKDIGTAKNDPNLASSSPTNSVIAVLIGGFVLIPPLLSVYNYGQRIKRAERLAGTGDPAPDGGQAAALDLRDLLVRVALERVQEQGGSVLRGDRPQHDLDVLAFWDRRVAVRRLRLVPRSGKLGQPKPAEPAAATELIDGRVVRDAEEPWQHPLLSHEAGKRDQRFREGLLHDVIGQLGVAGEAQEKGVDADLVRAVHELEGGVGVLVCQGDDLGVGRRARDELDALSPHRLRPRKLSPPNRKRPHNRPQSLRLKKRHLK